MFQHRVLETKHGKKGIPMGRQLRMFSEPRGVKAQSCREWPEEQFGFLGQGEKGDDTGVVSGSSV